MLSKCMFARPIAVADSPPPPPPPPKKSFCNYCLFGGWLLCCCCFFLGGGQQQQNIYKSPGKGTFACDHMHILFWDLFIGRTIRIYHDLIISFLSSAGIINFLCIKARCNSASPPPPPPPFPLFFFNSHGAQKLVCLVVCGYLVITVGLVSGYLVITVRLSGSAVCNRNTRIFALRVFLFVLFCF